MQEKPALKLNGYLGIIVSLLLIGLAAFLFISTDSVGPALIIPVLLIIAAILILSGITIVQPNEAKVLTLFGTYVGVIREQGLWVAIPLTIKSRVSLRVINFNSEKLKVNDLEGNPIEIAAVVVYKVSDSAKATFDVEDYEEFVQIQSETGIRHIASQYAYDHFEKETDMSLRKNSDEIADFLAQDLQSRLAVAGVDVIEARIMHLAYASEVASAMLQRQQAQAVLSARKVIVDGAVGLVKSAIEQLADEGVVELDDDKKAQMVNNLMVAIVSEKGTQPVINTGSIH
ncbi:Membrane protease subunits, stomatin/prohibitin homologs [Paenibacillus uliginis N3/975]|uniref:Membrane protease subunits, stomatin/prohibitin homologs n=1 Tax=Paenibacillus uliginis N3/975 TaxID=1313296 RepID=A0A1X7HM84_9BACL|nr:SPFH domain-containing protein [Paenibacillus uliginis]SMF88247.1 Membrane protease subunits, stomatin/prohibitin homologs [Paenibacillus uliginis N3/975]